MAKMLNKIICPSDPCVGDSLAGYILGLVTTILSHMMTLNVIKLQRIGTFLKKRQTNS
jgi:hypothetical protein